MSDCKHDEHKLLLRRIVDNEVALPEEANSASELVFSLMPNLKSTDPELRDELSYSILGRIIQKGLLSASDSEKLLTLAISDDYLFAGIGEQDTDTVFTRSFAVLIIAALVEVDSQRRILPEPLVHEAANSVMDYANRERDHRGYVDDKGWAHSVAHTADALDSCAQHPALTMKERIAILETIAEMVMLPEPLAYLEDDRLSFPVYRIIQAKQVSQEFLQSWMSRFDIDEIHSKQAALRHVNVQHFFQSLYFLLQWEQPNHPFIEVIVSRLRDLNIYYRYGPLGSTAEN